MFAYIDAYLGFRAGDMSLFGYLWRPHGEHTPGLIRVLTWVDVALLGGYSVYGGRERSHHRNRGSALAAIGG